MIPRFNLRNQRLILLFKFSRFYLFWLKGTDAASEEADVKDTNAAAEPELEAGQNTTETTEIDGITWISEPEYDQETAGVYKFTSAARQNLPPPNGILLSVVREA